jgi:UDP-N-acetylmuramoylalanine-D-glutamate ligase
LSVSAEANQETVRVGLLGIGLMGSAMAHRLLDRGIAVIAWDRDASPSGTGTADSHAALDGKTLLAGDPARQPAMPVAAPGLESRAPPSMKSSATVPVQPVWWLAPIPAPLSPWKYS